MREETRALLTAALIGAAIGAGLGLLASRSIDEDNVGAMLRSARKRARGGLRRGTKAAGAIGSRAGGAIGGARDAVGDFASTAREAFDDLLEREVRQLRKAARRQRRRFGL